MHYREYRPAPDLGRIVKCFWTLEGRAEAREPQPIPPDGCAEIVLNLGDRFERRHPAGTREIQPRRIVVGQMQTPVIARPLGAVDLFGIRFWPAGARPLLRVPAGELRQRILPFDDVSASLNRDLGDPVAAARTAPQRLRAAEHAIRRLLGSTLAPDPVAEYAARAIMRTHGMLSISALQSRLGVSSRQLERKFDSSVGLRPKLLCRILRFRRVFHAIECEQDWASVALACGFHDQAHLIRDFREFAGETPARFFCAGRDLTMHFSPKDPMSNSSNT